MVLAAGRRVGPYRIHSQIGVGGMGEVYRAWDAKLRRDVAVKVLPAAIAKDREYRARFEREAFAVAALSHPNILSIFDFGTDGGVAYAVTELLEGETLRARLTAAPISQAQALSFAVQIAQGNGRGPQERRRPSRPEAGQHVHPGGWPHQDPRLRPGEALRRVRRGFGVRCRCRTSRSPAPSWGRRATCRPSKCGATRSTTGRTSSRSGRSLYELLSGRKAFKKDTPADTMAAILNEVPADLSASGRKIPAALDGIVRRCLEKVPQERFQTAQEVVVALEQASSPGVESEAPSAPPRAGPGASSALAIGPTPTPSSRRSAPEAERRQVTVLVCGCEVFRVRGVSWSTSTPRTRPGCCGASGRRASRRCAASTGPSCSATSRGYCVCFGYPVAYEDAARAPRTRPWRSSMEMESLAGRAPRHDGLELGPWVGIHTGPAVVEAGEEAVSLAGEARNVAVRLKEVAEPGQIVCSGGNASIDPQSISTAPAWASARSGAGAARRALPRPGGRRGPQSDRGSGSGRADAADRPRPRDQPAQGSLGAGRRRAGQVVLLIGEAGLGKSRLVHTMKQHVREEGGTASSSDPSMSPSPQAGSDSARHRVALLAALPEHGPVPGHRLLRAVPRLRPRGAAVRPDSTGWSAT